MVSQENNFAFIDCQNLYLAVRNANWYLDWHRFRIFLYEKYSIRRAFLFLGYLPEQHQLYEHLKKAGFTLIFKPIIRDRDGKIKGNVDAEIVLHSAKIEYDHYDKAVVISGDGDFYCLVEFLQKERKLLKIGIPNKQKFSALLRPFRSQYMFFIGDFRSTLEYKKTGRE